MFFRRQAGHGLEPVCKMRRALFQRPLLHSRRDRIGHVQFQMGAVPAGLADCLVDILGQTLAHHLVIEHHLAKDLGDFHIRFHHNNLQIHHREYLIDST